MNAPVHLAYDPRDHRLADRIRQDLERRGWRVEQFALGIRDLPAHPSHPVIVVLPRDREHHKKLIPVVKKMAQISSPFIVISNPEFELPEWMYREAVDAVIPYGDGREYDVVFYELLCELRPDMPDWLNLRVRPTLLEQPKGVAWWSDDLVVADEGYEHLVRLGVDGASVLVPGLCEPHHVTIDRRDVTIANTGAHELLCVTIEDDMSTEFRSIREANGQPLIRPHLGSSSVDLALVVNTDRHEVLIQTGRLNDVGEERWIRLEAPDGFHYPCGAHADRQTVWVADTLRHRLVAFSRDGKHLGTFGEASESPGQLRAPVSVYAWQDYVFVGDEEAKKLQVYRRRMDDGHLTLELMIDSLGGDWIRSPFGLSVNRSNVMAVSDRDLRCVWLVSLPDALHTHAAD